ncbi:hypothetical protein [Chengkuizengella axinellae]|uniref:Uncharacterized protein n=1 Tax=Chengkuizengella axinellae TaxID=3064388 RepID=A0ABT9ITL4_9BACL|nr:hypothetical protein [Chengkuizengella sp. 2205SS18-9]MDP5272653.1 hypothetical protein [Chengkuizengella sp. 2205SS18-9]
MSFFSNSICDCCVCPIQSILEQLAPGFIGLTTLTSTEGSLELFSVNNFLAVTGEGTIPVCNISEVGLGFRNVILKPIKKNKGECACCEDPTTNLFDTMRGQIVTVDFLGPSGDNSLTGSVFDVGEGVVILEQANGDKNAISTCKTTRISLA